MTANEIRRTFLEFFAEKQHKIVPSAPIVLRNDPTLMFTNSGMVQFKDFFLGNQTPTAPRIADTQKCMRVSGKHNDLEDVGMDGTHHTMFEMLGNWSFGDYFKEDAIAWSWELLTERLGIAKDRLYATVFGGDASDGLPVDDEARQLWLRVLPADHILDGSKKDNFWEMGDTGPCGPCSEIHVDLRTDEERAQLPGHELVNKDHPHVIEIWNNVFIQFNRKADGSLEQLPAKHVDTGMGFERLCMVLQGKKATYDTDVFTPYIRAIEQATGHTYSYSYDPNAKSDIAMRVCADHLRSVVFSIADGQLPGNSGAGYVIRRILRRAVRYYYTFLGVKEAFLHTLLPTMVAQMGDAFPELKAQQSQIAAILKAEEESFLRTLENGLKRFADLNTASGTVDGNDAFLLYDTYGFPIDLTRLLAKEEGLSVDESGFEKALEAQRERARAAGSVAFGDWYTVSEGHSSFVGYDTLEVKGASVLKHRTVNKNGKDEFQIVLDTTPFYGESGGQAGDAGVLHFGGESIKVLDTQKENDLTIHIVERFPTQWDADVHAIVDSQQRGATSRHHSAVHLLHAALHELVSPNALQKGQSVDGRRLRFDFSHHAQVTAAELAALENRVNDKIQANIPLDERRDVPIAEAEKLGAMMLFGEKYGEKVRVITFDADFSRELCGGTHVQATGEIGYFKIVAESAVAAGIRRIEAVAGQQAIAFVNQQLGELQSLRRLINAPDPVKGVESLQAEVKTLKQSLQQFTAQRVAALKDELAKQFVQKDGYQVLAAKIDDCDANAARDLIYLLEREQDRPVLLLATHAEGKAFLTLLINKELAQEKGFNAGQMVRTLAQHVQGGGGGQAHFATAGGKNPEGLQAAIDAFMELC